MNIELVDIKKCRSNCKEFIINLHYGIKNRISTPERHKVLFINKSNLYIKDYFEYINKTFNITDEDNLSKLKNAFLFTDMYYSREEYVNEYILRDDCEFDDIENVDLDNFDEDSHFEINFQRTNNILDHKKINSASISELYTPRQYYNYSTVLPLLYYVITFQSSNGLEYSIKYSK